MLLPVLPALSLVACHREDDPEPPGPEPDLALDGERLLLRWKGRDRVFVALGELAFGVVDAIEADRSHDPWWTPLSDGPLAWREPDEIRGELPDLVLDFGDGLLADLHAESTAEGIAKVTVVPRSPEVAIAYVRVQLDVGADEAFYGLGSALDHAERRGSVRPVQLEVDATTEAASNEQHVHLPFVVSTGAWGFLARDDHPATVDFGAADPEELVYTVGLGADGAGGLAFDLYAAEHPLDVTAQYWRATGLHRLPARWALGPWHWRDENVDQAEVEEDLRTLRRLDLATTGVWIDRPYATGVNTFDFEAARFPDPDAMIDLAHDLGFRMALWHTPYTSPEDATELLAEATAGGYFPPDPPPAFIDWGTPIDFSNPEAYAWWQDLIGRYDRAGIEGYKLDYAEEVLVGAFGGRLPWLFHDGTNELTKHADYQRLYHRVYAETLPADGGFLLVRTGAWGDQVNGPIVWPGDLDATMERWGDEGVTREGEPYTALGGLPASLIDALSLGPSGFPFYGSDTGGYRHSPPDEETFVRWFEQTALSSVMQVGNSSNDVVWEPDEVNGFTLDTLDAYREFARLHLRLWPYLWTMAEEIGRGDGRPMMAPLGLAYPELGVHPDDEYLLGDALLVAPVVDRGARERQVVFPEGRWIGWFDGVVHEPGEETVEAGLYELPLYLRAGGMVPMLRETIDTLAPTTDPDVDSYATDPGVLTVRVFPGPASERTLFDGTVLEQREDGGRIELTWAPGAELVAGARFELIGTPEPADVSGGDSSWSPKLGGTLVVEVGPAPATVTIRR